jgi:cellulose synthase/poly-beta-1,6-N-acetylglucosamine synthase-like glycosyltransferase
MEAFVSGLLVVVAALVATSVLTFFLEVVAAIALSRQTVRAFPCRWVRPPIAVLVPAHNESLGLLTTLANIRSQLLRDDRLLVVADNCSDDTADVARGAGAEVVERNDPTRVGKGYALDWGVRHLSSNPSEIVLIVDADCKFADGAIDSLVFTCSTTDRPTQALYLMTAPHISEVNYQVAEFSWRVKNYLRPLGLRALSLPSQLMGTGMAIPWNVLKLVNLGSPQIVEDLKLGLDLALAGHPPLFCPSARITSEFPSSAEGAKSQRKRWEQGHLDTIVRFAPRLLTTAIARRDWNLLAITLDLSVPPLSLLGMLVLGVFGLSLSFAMTGGSFTAFYVSTACIFAFVTAIFLSWLKCGRDAVPPRALLLIPYYAVRKLSLYRQLAFGKIDSRWTRTDRTK